MIKVSVVTRASNKHPRPIFAWICPLCGYEADENLEEKRVSDDAVGHLMVFHNVAIEFIRVWVGAHGKD